MRGARGQSLCVVALKLVVHPLLVWLLAAFVFRLPPLWVDIAVLCAALPTGANVFLLAHRHGVSVQRSETAVLVSTADPIGTCSVLLALAHQPRVRSRQHVLPQVLPRGWVADRAGT